MRLSPLPTPLTSLAAARRARWLLMLLLTAAPCLTTFLVAPAARAEYFVLRSGQRLNVNAYELLGAKYRLQLAGGFVEMPASEVVSIEPEEIFTPNPAPAVSQSPFRELILSASARYNVDAELITSVIATESNFDPKAISRRNARGLMQLLPETASRLGVKNIFDPSENIDAGTRYLRDLLHRYGNDLALTLAAYNAGPERVRQYGRVPPFTETQSYVRRVQRTYDQRKSRPNATAAASSATASAGTNSTPARTAARGAS